MKEEKSGNHNNKKWIAVGIGAVLVVCILVGSAGYLIWQNTRIKPGNPVPGGTEKGDWEGDRVYLGSYEQDQNTQNGAEPILWRVLQVDGNEMLLLSEYALDVQPFHETFEDVTWETSTVRRWLNTEFYNTALVSRGSFDQKMVLENVSYVSNNQRYGTDGGNETIDKVFLLAWEDTYNESYGFIKPVSRKSEYTGGDMLYGQVSQSRVCYPTLYAAGKNALITRVADWKDDKLGNSLSGYGSVYWILRTPGMESKYISYVSRWGRTTYNFLSPVNHYESGIRPAIKVDLSKMKFEQLENGIYYVAEDGDYASECAAGKDYSVEIQNAVSNEPLLGTYTIATTEKNTMEELTNPVPGGNEAGDWEGDRVYFGMDESGNPILWRVLKVDEKQIMLFAEYGQVEMPYNEEKTSEWAECSLRKWLNDTFYIERFSEKEQASILTTTLENKPNPYYGISSGADTRDKVFLLSWEDVINESYGFAKGDGENADRPTQSNTRICYRNEEGLFQTSMTAIMGKFDVNGKQVVLGKTSVGEWWLRTAGFSTRYECDVDRYGDVFYHELKQAKRKRWVRPAIVLDKSQVTLIREADMRYPTIAAE